MKIGNTIEIKEINNDKNKCLCVIGCLKNSKGLKILDELLEWTSKKYSTYVVYQDYPGKLYEYPAIKFAQDISQIEKRSCLYVHTKGAFNERVESPLIRNLWKNVFFDNYDWCIQQFKKYENCVCCPFTGKTKTTWYNGFFANTLAWQLPAIKQSNNRFIFENIFKNISIANVIGYFKSDLDDSIQMTNYMRMLKHEQIIN